MGQILWTTWHGPLPLTLITAPVQVLGVYLVFASLIVPALAADGRLLRAGMVGVAGYALGLLASGLFDLPAGAAIVEALVGTATLGAKAAPQAS